MNSGKKLKKYMKKGDEAKGKKCNLLIEKNRKNLIYKKEVK
jgi:hypothetical protein